MTQIHHTKKVPSEVSSHFESKFPSKKGYEHRYYHYEGSKGQRVYGNNVMKGGKLHHNATQASAEDFAKMARSEALNRKKK